VPAVWPLQAGRRGGRPARLARHLRARLEVPSPPNSDMSRGRAPPVDSHALARGLAPSARLASASSRPGPTFEGGPGVLSHRRYPRCRNAHGPSLPAGFAGLPWLAALGGAVAPGFRAHLAANGWIEFCGDDHGVASGLRGIARIFEPFRCARSPPLGSAQLWRSAAQSGDPRREGMEAALCRLFGAKDPQNAEFLLPQVIGCDLVHLGVGTRRGCQELLGFRSRPCAALAPHRALPASTNARPCGRRWCWLHESPTSAIPSAADIGLGLSRRDARRRGHQPASRCPHRLEQAARRLPVSAQARAGPPGGGAGGYRVKRCRPCGRN
jgi:hypothetical protein